MAIELVTRDLTNADTIIPADAAGDAKHRLTAYAAWLDDNGRIWYQPDLAAYRDYLLSDERLVWNETDKEYQPVPPLSPSSTRVHLSTIRSRYDALLRSDQFRDQLYAMTPDDASPADRKAFVDEVELRIKNAMHPKASAVKVEVKQDTVDSEALRLTAAQASALVNAPKLDSLRGLRDRAIIALMLATGIREGELVALEVDDLRQTIDGELVLNVRKGKGLKTRAVPYGENSGVLVLVDAWLAASGIMSGPVFRGILRGGKSVRKTGLTTRVIEKILASYEIAIDGTMRAVRPHDLRRSYARLNYDSGLDLLAIKANLGHARVETTERYIGDLNIRERAPKALFTFDVTELEAVLAKLRAVS